MPSMRCLFAALTSRMHRWPILCRRGNEIGHFAGKRSHVDVWKAYNGDFASTRMGAAASHNQARRLRLAGPGGSMKRPSSRRPSPTGNVKVTNQKCQLYPLRRGTRSGKQVQYHPFPCQKRCLPEIGLSAGYACEINSLSSTFLADYP